MPCRPRATTAVLSVVRMVLSAVERRELARTVSLAVTVAPSGLRLTASFDRADDKDVDGTDEGFDVPSMRAAFAEAGGTLNVTTCAGGATVNGTIPATNLRRRAR